MTGTPQRDGTTVKRECIIVDMDGTLANCDHRRHLAQGKDWPEFFERMGNDKMNRWCRYLIEPRVDCIEIVVVTGRPEEYRPITEHWLDLHQITRAALFMRPTRDFRMDCDVKQEILDRDILPRWKPFFAIDDRQQVVNMWRRNGITTLQCDAGDF